MLFRKVRPILGRIENVARTRLSGLGRSVIRENLTYLQPRKLRRIEKALRRVLTDNVPGDVVEFGVALGGSAIVLADIAMRADRRFYGFDVFAMIPAPISANDDVKSKERYRIIASGRSEGIRGDSYYGYRDNLFEEVKQTFARYGLPIDNGSRFLCKGLFEETLSCYHGTVAFAHIDCDWYDPVKLCLGSISKKLSKGGIIVFDDYHDYGGARIAVDEFLAENHQAFEFIDGSNPFLRRTW